MTTRKRRILTFALFLLISTLGFGFAGGGDVPPLPSPPPPPGLPIDGGVFIGVIFALGLGVRKLLSQSRNFDK